MGIGRREFLRYAGLAVSGALIDPKQMLFLNGDYYVNKQLGLGFQKPGEWEFEALTGFPDFEKGQILMNMSKDETQEVVKDHLETLVAAICKYPSSKNKFGPCITIFRNTEDFHLYNEKPDIIARHYISDMERHLRRYTCFEKPERIIISNFTAIRFKSKFVFEHEKLNPTPTDDECFLIEHKDALYSIHLYDSPYNNDVAPKEFKRFISSLHLV